MNSLNQAFKLSLVCFLVAGSYLPVQTTSAALTDGLVAYYPFDGDATDFSTMGNDLTALGVGAATIDYQAGKVGQAVNLDRTEGAQFFGVTGTDLFGNSGLTTTDTSATAYTAQAWINPDFVSIADTPGDGYIMASTLSTVDNHGFVLASRIDGNGNLDAFVEKPSATGFNFETNGNLAIPSSSDGWLHMIVTWDSQLPAGPGELTVYVNNLLINTEIDDQTPTSAAMATDGLHIGADQDLGPTEPEDGDRLFDGLLDEIAIWNRVLTADERTALFNNGDGTHIIPEPTSLAIVLLGCGMMSGIRRNRR